ncbi:MAG: type 4a pilus biogenesis protein PilO [bacterium]
MELNYLKIKKFIPVLLILGFILILLFLIIPGQSKIKNLKLSIKAKQEALQNQEQQSQLFQELKESKKLEELNQILPSNPEVPELLLQLENMASQNNLILKSINFTESQNEITAQATLAGSYNALKNYIQALENNLRLIDLVSLNFQSPKDGSYYNFNLTIKAYYEPKASKKVLE